MIESEINFEHRFSSIFYSHLFTSIHRFLLKTLLDDTAISEAKGALDEIHPGEGHVRQDVHHHRWPPEEVTQRVKPRLKIWKTKKDSTWIISTYWYIHIDTEIIQLHEIMKFRRSVSRIFQHAVLVRRKWLEKVQSIQYHRYTFTRISQLLLVVVSCMGLKV